MLVVGGQSTNFNYVAYDGQTGLFVGGIVVDITTGSPVFNLSSVIHMVDEGGGVYVGQFTPQAGHFYTVISAVYTDNTYSLVNTARAPGASQFDTFISGNNIFTYNYAAYDFNSTLTINSTVVNLTDNTQSTTVMTHAALGVYFSKYSGSISKQYFATKVPTDVNYAPGADSFQCFNVYPSPNLVSLCEATLSGQSLNATLSGQSLNAILEGQC